MEARAGREFIFPTPLFLPAPPERKSRARLRLFFQKQNAKSKIFFTIFILRAPDFLILKGKESFA